MVKFLIIRFSSIGDIVLTTPVVRELKKQVEDAEIHYLTRDRYTEIVENNPFISSVIPYTENHSALISSLRKEAYDYIIDLQNNLRSRRIKQALKQMYFTVNKINVRKWIYVNLKIDILPDLHIVDRYLETVKVFDVNNVVEGLDYFIPEKDEIALSALGKAFSDGYLAFAIGAQHFTKILPMEKIIDVIDRLEYPVILIGGPEDEEKGKAIVESLPGRKIKNGCGKWSINQSASVIRQADCVIGHDSGMTHIAAAFHKKVLTVWGNTTPRFGMSPYMPDPQSVNFEVSDLKCRPCSKLGMEICPKEHFKCMTEHDTTAIAAEARKLIEQ